MKNRKKVKTTRTDELLSRITATATDRENITSSLTLKNAMVAVNAWNSVRNPPWKW
jgi:hypothetical protein